MEIKDTISSGLLELYVLGMASEQEIAEVNALAKKHPEIAAEIAAIESGLESYARLYAVEPGRSTKQKIFSEINTISQKTDPAKVVSLSSFWKYYVARLKMAFRILPWSSSSPCKKKWGSVEPMVSTAHHGMSAMVLSLITPLSLVSLSLREHLMRHLI